MKKWNEIYNNEEELIKDMLKAKADEKKYRYGLLVKGYTYINSFQNYYKKNGKLTSKQMTQLKRLAYEIYKIHIGIYTDKIINRRIRKWKIF